MDDDRITDLKPATTTTQESATPKTPAEQLLALITNLMDSVADPYQNKPYGNAIHNQLAAINRVAASEDKPSEAEENGAPQQASQVKGAKELFQALLDIKDASHALTFHLTLDDMKAPVIKLLAAKEGLTNTDTVLDQLSAEQSGLKDKFVHLEAVDDEELKGRLAKGKGKVSDSTVKFIGEFKHVLDEIPHHQYLSDAHLAAKAPVRKITEALGTVLGHLDNVIAQIEADKAAALQRGSKHTPAREMPRGPWKDKTA